MAQLTFTIGDTVKNHNDNKLSYGGKLYLNFANKDSIDNYKINGENVDDDIYGISQRQTPTNIILDIKCNDVEEGFYDLNLKYINNQNNSTFLNTKYLCAYDCLSAPYELTHIVPAISTYTFYANKVNYYPIDDLSNLSDASKKYPGFGAIANTPNLERCQSYDGIRIYSSNKSFYYNILSGSESIPKKDFVDEGMLSEITYRTAPYIPVGTTEKTICIYPSQSLESTNTKRTQYGALGEQIQKISTDFIVLDGTYSLMTNDLQVLFEPSQQITANIISPSDDTIITLKNETTGEEVDCSITNNKSYINCCPGDKFSIISRYDNRMYTPEPEITYEYTTAPSKINNSFDIATNIFCESSNQSALYYYNVNCNSLNSLIGRKHLTLNFEFKYRDYNIGFGGKLAEGEDSDDEGLANIILNYQTPTDLNFGMHRILVNDNKDSEYDETTREWSNLKTVSNLPYQTTYSFYLNNSDFGINTVYRVTEYGTKSNLGFTTTPSTILNSSYYLVEYKRVKWPINLDIINERMDDKPTFKICTYNKDSLGTYVLTGTSESSQEDFSYTAAPGSYVKLQILSYAQGDKLQYRYLYESLGEVFGTNVSYLDNLGASVIPGVGNDRYQWKDANLFKNSDNLYETDFLQIPSINDKGQEFFFKYSNITTSNTLVKLTSSIPANNSTFFNLTYTIGSEIQNQITTTENKIIGVRSLNTDIIYSCTYTISDYRHLGQYKLYEFAYWHANNIRIDDISLSGIVGPGQTTQIKGFMRPLISFEYDSNKINSILVSTNVSSYNDRWNGRFSFYGNIGQKITITIILFPGYKLENIRLEDYEGESYTYTPNENSNQVTITIPDRPMTEGVISVVEKSSPVKLLLPATYGLDYNGVYVEIEDSNHSSINTLKVSSDEDNDKIIDILPKENKFNLKVIPQLIKNNESIYLDEAYYLTIDESYQKLFKTNANNLPKTIFGYNTLDWTLNITNNTTEWDSVINPTLELYSGVEGQSFEFHGVSGGATNRCPAEIKFEVEYVNSLLKSIVTFRISDPPKPTNSAIGENYDFEMRYLLHYKESHNRSASFTHYLPKGGFITWDPEYSIEVTTDKILTNADLIYILHNDISRVKYEGVYYVEGTELQPLGNSLYITVRNRRVIVNWQKEIRIE